MSVVLFILAAINLGFALFVVDGGQVIVNAFAAGYCLSAVVDRLFDGRSRI